MLNFTAKDTAKSASQLISNVDESDDLYKKFCTEHLFSIDYSSPSNKADYVYYVNTGNLPTVEF